MAISLYDEAVYNKIRKWIPSVQFTILKPNETTRLFAINADIKNDEVPKLPLIAISRDPSITVDVVGRNPMSFSGTPLNSNQKVSIRLDAIPITINYQLDIYVRRAEDADELVREILFNAVNHPKMYINIPYEGANLQHVCNLILNPEVTDNSDIPEKLFPDQFSRWTIRFQVADAYLWKIPVKESFRIGAVQLELKDRPQPGDDVISTEWVSDELKEDEPEEILVEN